MFISTCLLFFFSFWNPFPLSHFGYWQDLGYLDKDQCIRLFDELNKYRYSMLPEQLLLLILFAQSPHNSLMSYDLIPTFRAAWIFLYAQNVLEDKKPKRWLTLMMEISDRCMFFIIFMQSFAKNVFNIHAHWNCSFIILAGHCQKYQEMISN